MTSKSSDVNDICVGVESLTPVCLSDDVITGSSPVCSPTWMHCRGLTRDSPRSLQQAETRVSVDVKCQLMFPDSGEIRMCGQI
jgi:hypothetical protein